MELRDRFFQTLMRTQWMDQARLDRYCDGLAARLCVHARETTPFYRDTGRLDCLFGEGGASLERWREVPILTRQDAIEAGTALHAESTPEEVGPTVNGQTSGSTGSVFSYRASSAVAHASSCVNERFADAHGLDGKGLLAQIIGFRKDAPRNGAEVVQSDWRFSQPGGASVAIDIAEPPAVQWAWLAAKRAAYLMTYATNARAIAEAVLRGEAPALRFKAVLPVAEMLEPDARQTIREGLHAAVFDRYGCQEAGLLATECPAGRYHVASEVNRIEVVDEAGFDVEEGGTGRVLITTLYNYAMPLLRYAIGDHATRAVGPCPCGRNGLTLARIAGRTRNLFRFADGSRRWPGLSFREMKSFLAFERLQVVQVALDRLELRYVPLKRGGEANVAAIEDYVRSQGMPGFTVGLVPVLELERGPGGKFEEFVSRL